MLGVNLVVHEILEKFLFKWSEKVAQIEQFECLLKKICQISLKDTNFI
jgi:hypothetical protein